MQSPRPSNIMRRMDVLEGRGAWATALAGGTVCALFLSFFAAISWLAARDKCATFDEPLHAVSAWVLANRHDFRVDTQNPPLWQLWAALPQGPDALKIDTAAPEWAAMAAGLPAQGRFCVDTLYRTPGVDADAFLGRSRAMMLAVGVALGGLIGWWAGLIGGPVAAVVSVAFYALDPGFLAHAPLVKNDVAFAFTLVASMFAVWGVGRKASVMRVAAMGLCCGAGLAVKFSGLLLPVLVVAALGLRALSGRPWRFAGRTLPTRGGRLVAALVAILATALLSWAVLWASYGFRFAATPDPSVHLPTRSLLEEVAQRQIRASHPQREASPEELAAWRPGWLLRGALFAEAHRLMPQAWTHGLVFTYMNVQLRGSFLMGRYSETGWWSYFPIAILFKTPLATLAAAALALVLAVFLLPGRLLTDGGAAWTVLCLALPVLVYGGFAMASRMDLGIRHVLAIYPFAFISIGAAAAGLAISRRGLAAAIFGVMILTAGAESLAAFPNFIPFFNALSSRWGGGINILGDSNLDWGQDLKLLARWRKDHPEGNLYLSYFGAADPAYYGLDYVPLPGGYFLDTHWEMPHAPGVIAISATNLQGIYLPPDLRAVFAPLARQTPIAVLGGTIYLFKYPAGE